jgi:hypothetical protein
MYIYEVLVNTVQTVPFLFFFMRVLFFSHMYCVFLNAMCKFFRK